MGLRFGKILPKWYVKVLLVHDTVGNTIKFRGTLKALCTNQIRKRTWGSGENSEVVIIIVMQQ
jgi:hypothetical protein